MDLEAMRAERARLDAQIAEAEKADRINWNVALDACTDALRDWLRERKIDVETRERKNEEIWDIGHGALTVTFGTDGEQWGRSLRMTSGLVLHLTWDEVPEPARMLAIVAALLNRKD